MVIRQGELGWSSWRRGPERTLPDFSQLDETVGGQRRAASKKGKGLGREDNR